MPSHSTQGLCTCCSPCPECSSLRYTQMLCPRVHEHTHNTYFSYLSSDPYWNVSFMKAKTSVSSILYTIYICPAYSRCSINTFWTELIKERSILSNIFIWVLDSENFSWHIEIHLDIASYHPGVTREEDISQNWWISIHFIVYIAEEQYIQDIVGDTADIRETK